jgi:small nuclear ribonucleoprotein (snRNP)-like protein
MKLIKSRPKSAFKVIAACFLAIALILPCFVSAKERKFGRNLFIKMKDGRTVEGELLAVKGDLLIMMEASSLTGVEVQLGEALYLKVNKKSKFLQGLELGFLSGAATGGVIGLLSGDDEKGWFAMTAEEKALLGALGFGILGMSIGGIAGAIAGIDESIDLTSMSPAQMNLILNKLKSYSRIADELPQNLKILPSTPTKEEYKAVEK